MGKEVFRDFFASSNIPEAQNSYWQKKRQLAKRLHQLQQELHSKDLAEDELSSIDAKIESALAITVGLRALEGRQAWVDAKKFGSAESLQVEMTPLLNTSNPISPEIAIWFESGEVKAELVFDPLYEGNLGLVHGGFIAAVFDEVLGAAQALSGKTGMTGTLQTRFHQPTPINQRLTMKARLKSVDGRKIEVEGELYCDAVKTASADAVFITKKEP